MAESSTPGRKNGRPSYDVGCVHCTGFVPSYRRIPVLTRTASQNPKTLDTEVPIGFEELNSYNQVDGSSRRTGRFKQF